MIAQDLQVSPISEALQDFELDHIISGSIGAVESVRFIRSLRRLGCSVHPWLTQGGSLFTTETALLWASTHQVQRSFEGNASHIATRDACIIAPASANMISKIAQGMTDTPASALVASYLGQRKPVIVVPNMHNSLMDSPIVAANLQKLASFCTVVQARTEEGKQKFPDPHQLADQVAHLLNQARGLKFLLTMGTTRGAIDDVRYTSNYSSGALGSRIADEFYRYGHRVHIVAGPSVVRPSRYTKLCEVSSNQEMSSAVLEIAQSGIDGAMFAASVLDFIPSQKTAGKISSADELKIDFVRAPKIIAELKDPLKFKVAFKLETTGDIARRDKIATEYLTKYQLSHLVYNLLSHVNETEHHAAIFNTNLKSPAQVSSKAAIAKFLVSEAERSLHGTKP